MAIGHQRAWTIQHEDGITVLFLEGQRSRQEAASVAREIGKSMNYSFRAGKRHALLAIPDPLRLHIARGKRINIEATDDGRVRLDIVSSLQSENLILLPPGVRI